MPTYRVTGIDFGEPTLPDSALKGLGVGSIVTLTLDPTVEATLLGAGLIERYVVPTPIAQGSVVVTADSTATIQAAGYPAGSIVFQVASMVGSPLTMLDIFVIPS